MNHECESCYYRKVRDVDPDTGKLAFGPFCLATSQPVKCESASEKCMNQKRSVEVMTEDVSTDRQGYSNGYREF